MKIFDTETTQSAIDQLIQEACESDSEVVPMKQGHQWDEPIQPDDDGDDDQYKEKGIQRV